MNVFPLQSETMPWPNDTKLIHQSCFRNFAQRYCTCSTLVWNLSRASIAIYYIFFFFVNGNRCVVSAVQFSSQYSKCRDYFTLNRFFGSLILLGAFANIYSNFIDSRAYNLQILVHISFFALFYTLYVYDELIYAWIMTHNLTLRLLPKFIWMHYHQKYTFSQNLVNDRIS